MPLHRRLPKRGFNNIFAKDYNEVNLGRLQAAIDAGTLDGQEADRPSTRCSAAGLVRRAKDGVRLLGKGELKAKLAFEVDRRVAERDQGGRGRRRHGRR